MKILLIVSAISMFESIKNIIIGANVNYQILGFSFMSNIFSFFWYFYSILIGIYTIVIYFKRSYSVLMLYLYIGILGLIIPIFNHIYLLVNMPQEQRFWSFIIWVITYSIVGLIFVYHTRQKKYFSYQ